MDSGHPATWHPEFLNEIDDWYFYRKWGMDDKAFLDACHDGVDEEVIFTYGRPLQGSVEAMNATFDAGHRVVIVTDRSFGALEGKASRRATYKWLRKYGFKFHEIHFTADKCQVPLDFMIDDKTQNFEQLTANGVDCYLMDKPWNQDCEAGTRRIHSFEEYLLATYSNLHRVAV